MEIYASSSVQSENVHMIFWSDPINSLSFPNIVVPITFVSLLDTCTKCKTADDMGYLF